ncbi:MAG TPA: hypothetical protein VJK30_00665 [Coxiellaceae bacterium]|nr:hypothetical protein [Coxiellaceae bacterium]
MTRKKKKFSSQKNQPTLSRAVQRSPRFYQPAILPDGAGVDVELAPTPTNNRTAP